MKYCSTPDAPSAIGPYSQAVIAGGFGFVSGQLGINPQTGRLVDGGVKAQASQAFRNLGAVARSCSARGLASVVRVTIYLRDMTDFPIANEVMERDFGTHKPARATIEVAGLPLDGRIEVDAILAVED